MIAQPDTIRLAIQRTRMHISDAARLSHVVHGHQIFSTLYRVREAERLNDLEAMLERLEGTYEN